MLAGGVPIKELAEYLGHSDPAFTLRVYAHMLPCPHDRARAVMQRAVHPHDGDVMTFKGLPARAPFMITEQRRNSSRPTWGPSVFRLPDHPWCCLGPRYVPAGQGYRTSGFERVTSRL